jgi:DNA polymerase-3 subunit gamma/tau
LFVGPRGVGKTSIARIMAKALNCMTNRKGVPCDTCSSCKEIAAGNSLDVLEIDGASNNGVDQIRDLRDNVKFMPARGPFKVYIIDEVHMLSIGAFNALLKTLEEPPPHVKFLFATTEPQKVPATILSRCQRFDLRRISTGDIDGHLKKIAAAEGIEIDDDAVLALARGAEGGLRDAESALDQVIAFRGKAIKEEDVLSVFGLVSRKHLEDVCGSVIDGDVPGILRAVAELDAAGKDLGRLAVEVLQYFRTLLVMSYAPDAISRQEIPEHQWLLLAEQTKRLPADRVTRIVELLIATQGQLKFALSRRIVLEMALIRAARAARVATLDEVLAELRTVEDGSEDASPAAQKKSPDPAPDLTPPPSPAPRMVRETPPPRPAAAPPRDATPRPEPSGPAPSPPDAGEAADEITLLENHWRHVCEKVGVMAPLARAYVRDTRPVSVDAVRCDIGCDPEFGSHIPYLQHAKCIAAFQKAIFDILGRKVTVHVRELDAQPAAGELPADIPIDETRHGDVAQDDADRSPMPEAARSLAEKRKWAEDPAVQRTLELFNGRISDVRD